MMPVLFSIKTKRGNSVDVYDNENSTPFSPNDIAQRRLLLNNHLGVNNERALPNKWYNCHGLTLVGRLGWFQLDSNINSVLNDNGFRLKLSIANLFRDKIPFSADIKLGDIVVYKSFNGGTLNITHTCTVFKINRYTSGGNRYLKLTVLSKLGESGEYFHEINNGFIMSIYGNMVEVWSNSI